MSKGVISYSYIYHFFIWLKIILYNNIKKIPPNSAMVKKPVPLNKCLNVTSISSLFFVFILK